MSINELTLWVLIAAPASIILLLVLWLLDRRKAVPLSRHQQIVDDIQHRADSLENNLQQLQIESAQLKEQLLRYELQMGQQESLAADLKAAQGQNSEYSDQIIRLEKQLLSETAAAKNQKAMAEERIAYLEQMEVRQKIQFENLANSILQTNSDKFSEQNKQSIERLLHPLKDQIGQFRQKVEEVYDKDSKERVGLQTEIRMLQSLNQKISQDAVNLTKALKGDSKVQGNWGELVLERLLEQSGLQKDRQYEVQVKLTDDKGRQRVPDVVIRLPENRDIIVDSKVSLTDYERYCAADDEAEQAQALKLHLRSIRNHVKQISVKEYAQLQGIRSLDFIFVFIPIESAFLLALQKEPSLYQEAYDKNVLITSPTTLLTSLRTVQNLWRYDDQNKNAENIAKQAGAIYDQLVLLTESFADTGKHLDRAQQSWQTTFNRFSKGRGNLVAKVDGLKKLGAKTKRQLAAQLVEEIDSSGDTVEISKQALDAPAGKGEEAAEMHRLTEKIE